MNVLFWGRCYFQINLSGRDMEMNVWNRKEIVWSLFFSNFPMAILEWNQLEDCIGIMDKVDGQKGLDSTLTAAVLLHHVVERMSVLGKEFRKWRPCLFTVVFAWALCYRLNHTSGVTVVTPTDRPKSVRNCCVTKFLVVFLCCDVAFWIFLWVYGLLS